MANDKVYTDYLMHGRTKGSRNGISTTKGYTAIGQKAKGHWVNGRYYYDEGAKNNWQQLGDAHRSALTVNDSNSRSRDFRGMPASAATEIIKRYNAKAAREEAARRKSQHASAKGASNNWQQIGNAHRSALTMNNANRRVQDYRGMPASVTSEIIPRDNAKMEKRPEVKAFNAWHNARQQHNAEVAGRNAAYDYAQRQKTRKPTNIGASQAADTARMNAETRNRVIGSSKDSLKKGASNNWQQQANAASSGKPSGYNNSHYNAVNQAAAERNAKEVALGRRKKGLGHPRNDYVRPGSAKYYKNAYENAVRLSKQEESFMGKPVSRMELEAKTKAAKAESQARNSRSDIGNAFADAKEDAKNAFKKLTSKSKFKKKKK